MKSNQAKYRISMMCRTPSARKQRDALLGDRIEAIHRRSRTAYGRPRIKAELNYDRISISNDRLARLMNERQLRGASRRKGIRATARERDVRPTPPVGRRLGQQTFSDQVNGALIRLCVFSSP